MITRQPSFVTGLVRLDRFITLNLMQPFYGVRIADHASRIRFLPILMYHSVADDPETDVHPYYRICTSPARFREQMQWLKRNSYCGVTLTEGLESKSEIKKVVLTFDDGFGDFYTNAWPILQEFGFTATVYLPTASIGDTRRHFAPSPCRGGRRGEVASTLHPSPSNPKPSIFRECLTWDEVRWLHRAGIEFGSHTVTHPKLTELTWPEVESELRNSKSEIEKQLCVPCVAFAYPYAFPQTDHDFTARFRDLLLAGGYETNVTTQIGRVRPGQNSLQLQRLPINQDDDLPLLAAKLAGAYDWVGRVQSLSKTLHRTAVVPPALSRSRWDMPRKAAERPSDDNSSLSAMGRRER